MMAARVDYFDFNSADRQPSNDTPRQPPWQASEKFRQFMHSVGLRPDGEILPTTERVERCPVADDKPTKKSGWYVFFNDGFAVGECGNWKTSETWSWSSKGENQRNAEEERQYRAQIERARQLREDARNRLAAAAAKNASAVWARATPCEKHPYLAAKGVKSFGLRIDNGKLLVPMYDVHGAIHSLQKITSSQEKRYEFGGEKKGFFFCIHGTGYVAICEGYATAASVHMATGWTVLVAFDAGNLLYVAEAWHKAHPGDKLIVCGDDDRWKEKNTGRTKGDACAAALGIPALYPVFATDDGQPTDWNDLHQREGLEVVRQQLMGNAQAYTIDVTDWQLSPDDFLVEPPVREDLVEDTFPAGTVCLLASLGGTGKSFQMTDLLLKVATETASGGMDFNDETFFGHRIMQHGPVIMYASEDTDLDNKRRIYSLHRRFPDHPVHVVSVIDAVGAYPLFLPGDKNGPLCSQRWNEVMEQAARIRPRLIVFDPLSSFASMDLNKSEFANYAMSMFAHLASITGACVIVLHHLAKSKDNITTPEQARTLVRGSTALIDRVRAAYVLWHAGEKQSREVCRLLGEEWKRNKIIMGCLCKENFGGDSSIKTFIRQDNGLLTVCDAKIKAAVSESVPDILDAIESACALAAERGQPFTQTGSTGIFERRDILPESLRSISKHKMCDYVQQLLMEKRLKKCVAKGSSTPKWLDVPGGDFYMGTGEIKTGAKSAE
ncbi:MAG: AAA family ATPase [Desulfovibrio sp.]|nr:AAA family ATPase [Desulfovibrio sp.]